MRDDLPRSLREIDERAERDLANLERITGRDLRTPPRVSAAIARAREEAPFDSVELVSAASLRPEPIRWLWPGWLARGKLHVLAGAPGTGKTTIALDLAASVTAGRALPSGFRPQRGSVLIWSGEDDPADTLVPRLLAAGADLTRVRFVGDTREDGERRPFDPARDVDLLAAAVAGVDDVALLIVDPLVSAVPGDSHKNAEVRRGLAPLVDLAARLDAALVGITHYSKGTQGREPLERVSGSLAFGALARVVFGTVRQQAEEGEPQRMLLARCKSNIGPDGGGFTYAFEQAELRAHPGVEASRIVWGEAVEGTARELLAEAEPGDDHAEARDAADWLRVLDARRGVEIVLARSAARFLTPATAALFQATAVAMHEAVLKNDVLGFLEADKSLDEVLARAGDNQFAARVAAPLQTHSRRFWYRFQSGTGLAESAGNHVALISAILERDEERAGQEADRLMSLLRLHAQAAAMR